MFGGRGGDRPLVYITVPPSQQELWFPIYSDKARTIPSLGQSLDDNIALDVPAL